MSIIELGALGEFLGSIGVIATLIYLAIQIRQNTHSLDEGRKLATAQAYQARASLVEESQRENVHSDYWPSLMVKYDEGGLDALSPEERRRYRAFVQVIITRLDNLHYQYQQGFLDEEFYQSGFNALVRNLAPQWEALDDLRQARRPSFREEVERILAESEENEQ